MWVAIARATESSGTLSDLEDEVEIGIGRWNRGCCRGLGGRFLELWLRDQLLSELWCQVVNGIVRSSLKDEGKIRVVAELW